jgi:hypothetical protein
MFHLKIKLIFLKLYIKLMLHLLFIYSIYYCLFFLHYFYIKSKDFLSPPLFVQNKVEGFLGSYPLFILILYHKLIVLSSVFLYIPMIFLFSMELKKFFYMIFLFLYRKIFFFLIEHLNICSYIQFSI